MSKKVKINKVVLIEEKLIDAKINETDKRKKRLSRNFGFSAAKFNNQFADFAGKEIEITRLNQALAVYEYAGSTSPGCPPLYHCAVVKNNEIIMSACYRNIDNWKIIN